MFKLLAWPDLAPATFSPSLRTVSENIEARFVFVSTAARLLSWVADQLTVECLNLMYVLWPGSSSVNGKYFHAA